MRFLALGILIATTTAWGQSSPKFRFAYQATGQDQVLVQGNGTAGEPACDQGCECSFLDSSGQVISRPAKAVYEPAGDFLICPSAFGMNVSSVRVTNGSKKEELAIQKALTLPMIFAGRLDLRRMRTISRYSCRMNFLEKLDGGTSPNSFSCSGTLSYCGSSNFCFIEAKLPFHLFADSLTNNYSSLEIDRIYNPAGSGLLCGSQIKQFDCSQQATGETLMKSFGLYAEPVSPFSIKVQLSPGPNASLNTYGYASPLGSSGICAPGLVKRDVFTAAIPALANTTLPAMTSTEFSAEQPANLEIKRRDGGFCNGTVCTVPNSPITTPAMSPSPSYQPNHTYFCVISPELL